MRLSPALPAFVLAAGCYLAATPTPDTPNLIAANPPSLIVTKALVDPWTVGIAEPEKVLGISKPIPGKVKIYDQAPDYDLTNEITTTPLAQLKNPGDTYTLDRSALGKKYWIVFYPNNGLINLTVTFQKANTQMTTRSSMKVQQLLIKHVGVSEPTIKTTPGPKATFREEYFQRAGDRGFEDQPLLVLQ